MGGASGFGVGVGALQALTACCGHGPVWCLAKRSLVVVQEGRSGPGRALLLRAFFLRALRSEGSRSGFVGQVFFGGLGHPGQKTTHFQEHRGILALPPSAARPKNNSFPEKVLFFSLGTPGLPKNTWPKDHFGIPLNFSPKRQPFPGRNTGVCESHAHRNLCIHRV